MNALGLIAVSTFIAVLSGGLLALKVKSHLNRIMGFTAGVILGVVCLEILPEIIHLVQEGKTIAQIPMLAMVFGFLIIHIIEKVILIHHSEENDYAQHTHPHVGLLSAIMLVVHSFLDGLGIAVGFMIDPKIGLLIGIAVIGHNFADGLNTVALLLAHNNSTFKSKIFLLIAAIAPSLGIALSFIISIPENFLAIYLGYFAGSLLYIGASEILPEAHRENNSYSTVLLTILGVFLILLLTRALPNTHQ